MRSAPGFHNVFRRAQLIENRVFDLARRYRRILKPYSGSLIERRRNAGRHLIRRRLHRISREVRIAGCRLDLRVAEQLADHRQSLAGSNGCRRKCVPQVVNANVLESRPCPHPLPEWLQVGEPGAGQGADDHPAVILDAADRLQHLDRRVA